MIEDTKNKNCLLAHHDMATNCSYEIEFLVHFFFVLGFYQNYKYASLKLRAYTGSRVTMNRGKANKVDFTHKTF